MIRKTHSSPRSTARFCIALFIALFSFVLTGTACSPSKPKSDAADRARWAKRAERVLRTNRSDYDQPNKGLLRKEPLGKEQRNKNVADASGKSPEINRKADKLNAAKTSASASARRSTKPFRESYVPKITVTPETVFADSRDDKHLFTNHRRRYKVFKNPRIQKRYNTRRTRGTVQIQYSDDKRLYDHNILLAAMFQGRLRNARLGNLKPIFNQALFFDLGSAVLYKRGAVTVRAIHDDARVMPYLSAIVASDINDYRSPKTEFINIFRKRGKILPFPVEEIDMSITRPHQVDLMLRPHLKHARTPVILRTVNTGIDYYYSESQLRRHFQAVLVSNAPRNLIYLFNRFVMLKPAGETRFHIIGEVSALFRAEKQSRRQKIWRRINWKKRRLEDGFKPRKKHIRILEGSGPST